MHQINNHFIFIINHASITVTVCYLYMCTGFLNLSDVCLPGKKQTCSYLNKMLIYLTLMSNWLRNYCKRSGFNTSFQTCLTMLCGIYVYQLCTTFRKSGQGFCLIHFLHILVSWWVCKQNPPNYAVGCLIDFLLDHSAPSQSYCPSCCTLSMLGFSCRTVLSVISN